jgi:hypothetical protein
MKHTLFSLIGVTVLVVLLVACGSASAPAANADANVLVVGDGATQKSYTAEA